MTRNALGGAGAGLGVGPGAGGGVDAAEMAPAVITSRASTLLAVAINKGLGRMVRILLHALGVRLCLRRQ